MEPLHPTDLGDVQDAFYVILIVLLALVAVQVMMGDWDKFIAVAVKWFPIWHWGG